MPYTSAKQRGFAHTPDGKKAVGEDTVEEFDHASKGTALPEKAPKKPSIGKRIMDMVKPAPKKVGR